ncbi:hypothetical protein HDU79_004091 [Rhizoclosmatium sp. JEL0117]|nr:hypothetical protein HDU79_004091 [Rhizoclosmatium sp. JEL0117]
MTISSTLELPCCVNGDRGILRIEAEADESDDKTRASFFLFKDPRIEYSFDATPYRLESMDLMNLSLKDRKLVFPSLDVKPVRVTTRDDLNSNEFSMNLVLALAFILQGSTGVVPWNKKLEEAQNEVADAKEEAEAVKKEVQKLRKEVELLQRQFRTILSGYNPSAKLSV